MEISKVLKNFRAEAEQIYGPRLVNILLYGSWARRNPTPDSDIDLALVLDGDVAPGQEIDRLIDVITDINLEYGVLLSVYPISRNDYQTINSPVLMNLRTEGIPA